MYFFVHSVLTDDELQSGVRAFADTFNKKVIDSGAGLNLDTVLLLPPGDGAVLRFDEALAEH